MYCTVHDCVLLLYRIEVLRIVLYLIVYYCTELKPSTVITDCVRPYGNEVYCTALHLIVPEALLRDSLPRPFTPVAPGAYLNEAGPRLGVLDLHVPGAVRYANCICILYVLRVGACVRAYGVKILL